MRKLKLREVMWLPKGTQPLSSGLHRLFKLSCSPLLIFWSFCTYNLDKSPWVPFLFYLNVMPSTVPGREELSVNGTLHPSPCTLLLPPSICYPSCPSRLRGTICPAGASHTAGCLRITWGGLLQCRPTGSEAGPRNMCFITNVPHNSDFGVPWIILWKNTNLWVF